MTSLMEMMKICFLLVLVITQEGKWSNTVRAAKLNLAKFTLTREFFKMSLQIRNQLLW